MNALLFSAVLLLSLHSSFGLAADDSLMTNINTRMHAAGLYISDLKVDMENGIATIYGTAKSPIQRDEIMEVVSMTYGVKGAINRIEVN